jgi:membrane protein
MIDRAAAWSVLKAALSGWLNDRCLSMGAAISYFAVFSLAPMLILAIAIAGFLFGPEAAQGAIVGQLRGLMGREGAAAIQAMIESAADIESGLVATAVGVATLIFAASGAFAEIQEALNIIWKVKSRRRSLVGGLLRQRLRSLSLVAIVGFLLMASLVVSAALAAFDDYLHGLLPGFELILQALNLVVSFAVITVLFAMVFKVLPDVDIAWGDVWLGAAVTAFLFSIAKFLISLYIGSSEVTSSYGAAGALVIVLLWIYYSSLILLFGAEITYAYARRHQREKVAAGSAPGRRSL